MAKEKVSQNTEEVIPEEVVTPEVIEAIPEVTTPSIEDLQKQLQALQEQSKQLDDNWKASQRDSSKKNLENQQLREQLSRNESQEAMLQALIAVIAQQQQKPSDVFEAEVKDKQPDLLKQYETIREKIQRERKQGELTLKLRDIQERTETLGLSPDSDDYSVIRAFAESGQFDKAEKRLVKLEVGKETKPMDKPKETEEERINRLAVEKAKEMLGDKLKQDTGSPTGGAATFARIRDEYIEDPNNPGKRERYLQARKEKGI